MHAPTQDASVTDLCDRLKGLPTAVVSDVLGAMGLLEQVLSSSMRAVSSTSAFAGPALCLSGSEGPDPDALPNGSKPVFEIDRRVSPGCVAVIATGGHKLGAVIGGNVALSWHRRGCAGVVTDGGIRDAAECEEMALPVFATFVGPMSNKGLWAFREIGVPVVLPGQRGAAVTVMPGDIVHADGDGVVIIPASLEAKIRADLLRGEDREAVYRRHDKFGHIKPA